MNSGIERIVFNRDLKTEEYVSLSFFMVGFMQKYRDEDLYYYVEVSDDLDLHVTTYDAYEVQWQASELLCTDHEALVSMTEFDGFYEEVMEILWRNNINSYDRYVAQTKETIGEGLDPRWCIASTEEEAYHYFSHILKLKDIITVRKNNEETL